MTSVISTELNKLLRQSVHYLAGLIGAMAMGFISFPIFTRAFSVADYGAIDYVQKIILLLTAGAKLGLQNSALRFYDARQFGTDRQAERRYYSTLFYSVGLVAAAVAVTFSAAIWLLPRWVADAPLASILCFAGTLVFLRGLESMFWSFLRAEERTKAYSLINVTLKAATIAAVCILLPFFGGSPRTYFTGIIGVEGAAVAFLTVWLIRRGLIGWARFDWPLARKSVTFGVPLVAYELSSLVLDSGDRFLVRRYLGPQALGLYSVAYGLSSYVNEMLLVPLGLAMIPICMRLWNTEGPERTAEFLSTGLDLFLMAACGILAGVCTLSRDGVLLLASSRYSGAERIIPMLVGGLLLYTTYIFLSAGLLIQKETMTMARLLFWSAAANIALNVFLLPRIGLAAAAVSTLLSYALCILLLGRASFRVLPLRFFPKAFCKYLAGAGAAWALASRIDMGAPLPNILARGGTVILTYGGLMFLLDRRVRRQVAWLLRWTFGRMELRRTAPAELGNGSFL